MGKVQFLLALIVLTMLTGSAKAASFDCTKAATKTEQLICGDSTLGSADAELDALYKSDLAGVSEAGKEIMRTGQREWLKYIQNICSAEHTMPNEQLSCLQHEYSYRQKQLAKAVVKSNDLTVLRVDLFKTQKTPDTNSTHPGLIISKIAYPQIDEPQNEAEETWNKYIKKQVLIRSNNESDEGGMLDKNIDYNLAFPGARAISTTLSDYEYPHGAAHGQEHTLTFIWLLDQKRNLKADDLFDDSKNWKQVLDKACFDWLMANDSKDTPHFDVESSDKLDEMATNPDRWTFGPEGLFVQFNHYEVGSYVAGMPKAVVPWQTLKPYLVENPPIEIPE